MLIQVHNTASGPDAGWMCVSVEASDKVSDVLDEYVRRKNLQPRIALTIYGDNGLAIDTDDTIAESGLSDGASVYIGTSQNQRSMFTFEKRWWIFLALLALLAGGSGLVWAPLVFFQTVPVPFDYGVVVDAGSSGSRVSLYQWIGGKYNGTGLVVQIKTCTTEPGLTEQNASYSAVSAYFYECFEEIRGEVPKSERYSTPVYLAATAGMRLLRLESPDRSNMLMEAASMAIQNSQLLMKRSEIITGHEEGIDGWITVNFLKGVLHDQEVGNIVNPVRNADFTFGAMDMGGASTQITFEVDEDTVVDDIRDSGYLKLYGRPYRIFAHSFLCYGVNEAYRRYLALQFVSTDGDRTLVDDPCGNLGRARTYSLSYLFGSPCTEGIKPPDFVIGEYDVTTMVGAWNETKCDAAVARLFDVEDCTRYSQFCFNSSLVPPRLMGTSIVAFSIFYYLHVALELEPATSQEEFEEAAFQLCELTADEMNRTMSKATRNREDIAAMLCFEAVFVRKMLVDEYKMTGDEFKRIEFRNKLPDARNGTNIGWSLGYMINATNALPVEEPGRPMSSLLFSFLVFVFVGLVGSGLFLAYHAWILSRQRKVYNDYQRLNSGDPGNDYLKL